jgi:RNA polymerase sigma-70 factor (ECF subfamily)
MNESARRISSQGAGDEHRLVRSAQAGDQKAFGDLVRLYRRSVYRICYGLTRSHEDADDLAQETFVRAYRALSRFRAGEPLLPWLARIAINTSYSLHRYRKRRPETSIEPLVEAGRQWGADDDPSERVEEAESRAHLMRAFEQLSPEHQAVLVLRVEQEMSYEDIARSLGVPVGTVMSRLARARAELRQRLRALRGEGNET